MHDAPDRFREAILATLGHAPTVVVPGRLHRFATRERRGDSAGWCKLFDDLRGGVFGCHRQEVKQTWSADDRHALTRADRSSLARQVAATARERERQQRDAWAINDKRIAALRAQSVPVTSGDPVYRYLCRRLAIDAFTAPPCLRVHPALDCWHDGAKLGTFPAMVATVLAPDGRTVALHRTYLTRDGRKADVPVAKKLTGAAGSLAGACIRLHTPMRDVIGVAEGIETALAASLASGVPTVAAYCANALAGYRWPTGVRRLVIFSDNDKAGREASNALQSRAVRAGLQTCVLTPSAAGADWLDVWAARGAVALECAA